MYKELYFHLFNSITDALIRIKDKDSEEGIAILEAAQREVEERYMESEEGEED